MMSESESQNTSNASSLPSLQSNQTPDYQELGRFLTSQQRKEFLLYLEAQHHREQSRLDQALLPDKALSLEQRAYNLGWASSRSNLLREMWLVIKNTPDQTRQDKPIKLQ